MATKTYGTVSPEQQKAMSGLEFVKGLASGTLSLNTIAQTLGYDVVEAESGRVVITLDPTGAHLNPWGTVHGGLTATLLDSCMGLAVQSTLEKGVASTTLEFKISLVRAITLETGRIRAEGKVLNCGRRVGTAEGRVTDAKGDCSLTARRRASFFQAEMSLPNRSFLANDRMQDSTTTSYIRGALYGLTAVCIWAAFIVVSRLGVSTSLTPWDVAAIRFCGAGLLLCPYLLRKRLALDRLGWTGLMAIAIGCGAPMVLLVSAGLLFAPAAHGGALFPGVMPLMVAVLAAVLLKEAFTPQKVGGLILILLGAIGIVWASGGTIGTRQNIGHLLFLCAGLAWASYTVAMRRARLDGLHAAAISAVASLVLYVPIYAVATHATVLRAPLFDVALQAIVQGVLTAIFALLLYGRMVAIFGATGGAAFVALTPAMTALLAIPVLGEWPSSIDWIAICLISIGVYFVSGGPLPARRV